MSVKVSNIKISIKIPSIDLNELANKIISSKVVVYKSFIVVDDKSYCFTFFRKGHINVTRLRGMDDVLKAVEKVALWTGFNGLAAQIDNITVRKYCLENCIFNLHLHILNEFSS